MAQGEKVEARPPLRAGAQNGGHRASAPSATSDAIECRRLAANRGRTERRVARLWAARERRGVRRVSPCRNCIGRAYRWPIIRSYRWPDDRPISSSSGGLRQRGRARERNSGGQHDCCEFHGWFLSRLYSSTSSQMWGVDWVFKSNVFVTPLQSSAIVLRRQPMRSTSTSTTSPGFMNIGGLRRAPTPPGVPVTITSPDSSGTKVEQ